MEMPLLLKMIVTDRNHMESYLEVVMSGGTQVAPVQLVEMGPGLLLRMQDFILSNNLHMTTLIITTLSLDWCFFNFF